MLWLLSALSLSFASANSSGSSQCDARSIPNAMGGTLSNTGWSMAVSPSGFSQNTPITVTITGPPGAGIRGIQMYVEDSSNSKYGVWATKTGFKASAACGGDPALTHSSSTDKAAPATFTWTSPSTDPGVATLDVRALILTVANSRIWATVSTSLNNLNTAATSAPTTAKPLTGAPATAAPTKAPTQAVTGAPTQAVTTAPTLAVTGAPTTHAPTTSAPTASACQDGLQGTNEIGIDCGGPCPACPTYVWKPQAWTPCSLPCGGGVQTRSVKCVDGVTGEEVSSANCTMAHEAETSIACNPDPCPKYAWSVGAWEACSSPCNGGTRTRSVLCLSDVGNVTVADTNCGGVTKPTATEDCNTEPCIQAHWVSLPWGTCSVTCGGGTQSRTVQCQDAADKPTTEESCMSTTKPVLQQSCNTASCSVYIWNPCPDFYPCTSTCNGGTGMLGVRYKDVFCVELSTLATVDASLCDPTTKPRTNYTSCNPQPCTGYNWMANGNWGPCEASADNPGKFVRSRTFHCHTPDGGTALNQQCLNVPQPVGELECTPNTCLKIPDYGISAAFSAGISGALLMSFILFCV